MKLPWLTNVPRPVADRPRCLWCGCRLAPKWSYVMAEGKSWPPIAKQFKGYGLYGENRFHAQQCATGWARWAVEELEAGRIPALLPVRREK